MNNQELVRFCASCGANNAPEAQFCGACGRELPEEAAEADSIFQGALEANVWQVGEAWPTTPDAPEAENDSSLLGEMAAAAQAPTEGVQQKRCDWCGNLNPWVAAACESCGALFPIPEQDAAYRRAAEERLRQEEANLERWKQRQRPRWRRLF